MQKLEMELTEKETLTLEYRVFEYQGLQINLNQFLNNNYEFNEEHYNRLIETLIDKYTLLQHCLFNILESHGYKNISVKSYDFYLTESTLTVIT